MCEPPPLLPNSFLVKTYPSAHTQKNANEINNEFGNTGIPNNPCSASPSLCVSLLQKSFPSPPGRSRMSSAQRRRFRFSLKFKKMKQRAQLQLSVNKVERQREMSLMTRDVYEALLHALVLGVWFSLKGVTKGKGPRGERRRRWNDGTSGARKPWKWALSPRAQDIKEIRPGLMRIRPCA